MPTRTPDSHPRRPYSYNQGSRSGHTHIELDITDLDKYSVADADATFLKLDASNDPMTAELEVPGVLTDYVQFDTAYVGVAAEGCLMWNTEDGTLEYGLPGGNVNLQVGQEQVIRCRNTTGVPIPNGSLVYIVGASGNKPLIDLADATDETKAEILGYATETINHNSNGYVTLSGLIRDVDTDTLGVGSELFLSTTAGEYTTTKPTPPNFIVHIGHVIADHASTGVILAHIFDHTTLDHEVSDVLITSVGDNEILQWNAGSSVWENQTLAEAGIATTLDTVTPVSTTYTVLTTDQTVLADATGGAFDVTLPTAVGNTGKTFTIKKIDAAFDVTLEGDGVETIDGALTRVLSVQYEAFTVQSDGTEWWIL